MAAKKKTAKKAAKQDLKKNGKKGGAKAAKKASREEIRKQAAEKKAAKLEAQKNRKCSTQDPNLTDKDLNTTKHKDWTLTVKDLKKVCTVKPVTPLADRCHPCKKTIRKEQLRVNNIDWRKRVADGTAGHHKQYRNKPTEIVRKLEAVGVKGDKLAEVIKQGGKGEKIGLPPTLAKKIEKVELPNPNAAKQAKKDPNAKKAKPTREQKAAAKSTREAMKKTAKPAPKTIEEVPRAKKDAAKASDKLNAGLAKAASAVEKIAAAETGKATEKVAKKAKKALDEAAEEASAAIAAAEAKAAKVKKTAHTPVVVATTQKDTRMAPPLDPGEIYAKDAKQGSKYNVAGQPCAFLSMTDRGYSFKPDNGDKPYMLTAHTAITPL